MKEVCAKKITQAGVAVLQPLVTEACAEQQELVLSFQLRLALEELRCFMKRKEHVLDLMQDLHVPKYLRGDEAYQRQKRKREREHEKVKRLRRRWTRSHEYPAPFPTDAPPFPLEGAANVSYSEQRRAWNQMAHAKEWNANRPPDVLKLTFNSAAGAGVEQEPEPAP